MAGYKGYSMSNNAVRAYEDGEMPISKWTRQAVIDWIADDLETDSSNIKLLKRYKDYLYYVSWHHTSKYYNRTEFFRVEYTLDEIQVNDQSALDRVKSKEIKKEIDKLSEELNASRMFMDRWNPDAIEILQSEINHMENYPEIYRRALIFDISNDWRDDEHQWIVVNNEKLISMLSADFSFSIKKMSKLVKTEDISSEIRKMSNEYIEIVIAVYKDKLELIHSYPEEIRELESKIEELRSQLPGGVQ